MASISVIIPFHDRIEWTKHAIQSVLAQTFQDFEIILVDDGSSRDYSEEIKRLDNRILYLRQEQRGPSSARNTGLRAAKSKFIAFLDSDDAFLPTKLEIQYNIMMNEPNALLSHTSYRLMDKSGNYGEIIASGMFTGQVYPAIFRNCPIATPTVMLRREFVHDTYFNESINVAEDILFWAEISKRSKIIGIDVPLTLVRIHGSNAAYDPEKQIAGIKNLIQFGILSQIDSIGWNVGRHILCDMYFRIGFLYFTKRIFFQCIIFFKRAFVNSPLRFLKNILNRTYSGRI